MVQLSRLSNRNVSGVTRNPTYSQRLRRRIFAVRLVSVALAGLALAGMIITGPVGSAPADAAASTSSALTIKWTGDSSSARAFQPVRATSSAHYPEFNNLQVTVGQTTGITDQAVRVSVTGFAGTRSSLEFGQNAMNYLQAMQCWGADPLAADFMQTCEWGGRYTTNNGLGNSVYVDNALRVAARDADLYTPTSVDNPFRTFQGKTVSAKPRLLDPDGAGPLVATSKYDILDYFNPSTTNEVTSARVGSDGTGYFDFETQSADQAPQLSCGSSGHLRCWLVVVPRGTVFGGDGAACSGIRDPANNYDFYTKGRPNSIQGGSPVNPQCDYWDNRVVVPLDFTPVGSNCPVGSAEQRVVGSQLMVGAMSSWQPALCQSVKTTFSFSTNPDSIARSQILDGEASTAFMSYPLSAGELTTNDERQQLADSHLSYAPVAVSGVVISFLAEFDSGRISSMNLSPRLVAKLLTQSYTFTVPWNSSDPVKNFAHLPAINRSYTYLNQDPEFQRLNPTNYQYFTQNPAIVLPGPSGADAIRQVWRWILADSQAASFLSGAPDDDGMTVNPYYLPAGNVNAVVPTFTESGDYAMVGGANVMKNVGLKNLDGSPMKLSETTLDTFLKADQSLVPLKLNGERSRFDSIQFAPYVENLLTGARSAFRADANSKTLWDGSKIDASGRVGDWVSSGSQAPGRKFTIAITDSPSAVRYSLDNAGLLPDNGTVPVQPDSASFTAALPGLRATSLEKVTQVDPGQVPTGGYPLTMVTYQAVNLTGTTAASRPTIAAMLRQVTTSGQVSGTESGMLPLGYTPLPSALVALAESSAAQISSYVPPASTSANSDSGSGFGSASSGYGASGDGAGSTSAAGGDPAVTEDAAADSAQRTQASGALPIAKAGLGLSLGVGLAGAFFAPILFRGKGFF